MTSLSPTPLCIVCNASDSGVFWCDRNRTIRECRSCGLLFVFPQPDQTTLHNHFQSDYFAHSDSNDKTRLELEFEAWRRPMLKRIEKQICAWKSEGKLLDVGCASGALFEYFRSGDWELYGIEPSATAFERARQRFGDDPRLHLFNAYLREVSLEQRSFDVITVLESLYYMPNPRQELSYLARLLRDDGLLAIAVPGYAYQRLRRSGLISYLLHGSRCSLTASHLFYFSKTSMAALLKSAGLHVVETIPLGSSVHGSRAARFASTVYITFSGALNALTLGHLNLAPHVLYFCRKTEGVRA
jgi:SAM-dependent methyltransferase